VYGSFMVGTGKYHAAWLVRQLARHDRIGEDYQAGSFAAKQDEIG
jgi:hypothetical protein